jgi:hypothetical protein
MQDLRDLRAVVKSLVGTSMYQISEPVQNATTIGLFGCRCCSLLLLTACIEIIRMTGGHVQYIEPIEGDFYCSKSCRSFTQQLAVQLVKPLERLKPSVLQKALAKPSHKPQQQGVGAQGGGVTTMKSVIEVILSCDSLCSCVWC